MHTRVGHRIRLDQFALRIRLDVVLVAVMPLVVLLGPARVHVLLPLFRGLFAPRRRRATALDRGVFLARVALARHIHEAGVHQFAGLRQQAARAQLLVEEREELLERARFDQRLAEVPERVGIRDFVGQRPTDELLETEAVVDLIFGLLVGKVVEALHQQRLEHLQPVVGGATTGTLGGFVQRRVQQGAEHFPIHNAVQTAQRIAFSPQPLLTEFHIEKSGRGGGLEVLHNAPVASWTRAPSAASIVRKVFMSFRDRPLVSFE